MVMVDGLMVAGSVSKPVFNRSWGPAMDEPPGAFGNRKSNVARAQAGYPARSVTEAPETRIYFTTHRSGANSVPRVRTVSAENGQVGRL